MLEKAHNCRLPLTDVTAITTSLNSTVQTRVQVITQTDIFDLLSQQLVTEDKVQCLTLQNLKFISLLCKHKF